MKRGPGTQRAKISADWVGGWRGGESFALSDSRGRAGKE